MEQEKENQQIIESPFKKFWDSNKELVSFTGIVIAIGSMFLRVPIPEQLKAAEALQMIQFLSIFIMSIAIVWLWLSFLSFSYQLESHFSKKTGLNLSDTISNAVFMLIFYFVYNLWVYIISLYKTQWQKVIGSFQNAVGVIVIALVIYFTNKIYDNKEVHSRLSIILRLIGSSLLVSIIPTLWILFSKLQFVFHEFLRSYLWNVGIYFLISIGFFLFRLYKNKKNLKNE